MEYRYDGPTQRYMVRPRDPETLAVSSLYDGSWHDYDGGAIQADWTIDYTAGNPPTFEAHEQSAQVAGLAQYDYAANAGERQHYLHSNLIGTTVAVSNSGTGNGGSLAGRRVYTAFGELVDATGFDTRYGYAGAWGYQAAGSGDPLADLGWVHVGYRHYDPACGRFVQRDPIGIEGGANVYAYCGSSPAERVDPSGEDWIFPPISGDDAVCRVMETTIPPPPAPISAPLSARAFLIVTGGSRQTYLDRVGDFVGRNTLDARITSSVCVAASRLSKVGAGVADTKSIFEVYAVRKTLGITIRTGMNIGRVTGVLAIAEGLYNTGVIVTGAIVCW